MRPRSPPPPPPYDPEAFEGIGEAPDPAPRYLSATDLLFSRLSGLIVLAVFAVFLFRLSAGATWGSYYLVWLVVPLAAALLLAHPLLLVVVAIGLLARPWLPDPFVFMRHARRARSLDAEVRANPANVKAHHDLATIWLAKRRPRRALVHVEVARVRDPDDLELRLLEGECQAMAGRHEDAIATHAEIVKRNPRFRFGEASLRAADSQLALKRWSDAEASLRAFLKANSSSVEAHVKLAKARARQGDGTEAAAQRRAARALYRELPAFQRRKQRVWYLRALVGV